MTVNAELLVARVISDAEPVPAGASLDHIETPAAVVDLPVMAENLIRTAGYCRRHGLLYRPHAKTHKAPGIGRAQLLAGASGLTVATLREAEVMAEVTDDLLVAYPQVGPAKLSRLVELAGRVARVSVALDSREALTGLITAAASPHSIGVVIEVDAGMGRAGVQTPEAAVDLARAVAGVTQLRYDGIMFYPGHIREAAGEQDAALTALRIRLEQFLAALHTAGLAPPNVSGGSTPTLWRSHEITGLTEIRPGTTVFNDRATAVIEACRWEECAYSVLATVVSTAVPGQAVIDAGSKALAKEELRGPGGGYGALRDRPGVVVKALSEEHGILDLARTTWRPRVGDRVRVIPNHVCVSVNLQERIWGGKDDLLLCQWPVLARERAPRG